MSDPAVSKGFSFTHCFYLFLLARVLTGCGGGGGNSSATAPSNPPPSPTPPSNPPAGSGDGPGGSTPVNPVSLIFDSIYDEQWTFAVEAPAGWGSNSTPAFANSETKNRFSEPLQSATDRVYETFFVFRTSLVSRLHPDNTSQITGVSYRTYAIEDRQAYEWIYDLRITTHPGIVLRILQITFLLNEEIFGFIYAAALTTNLSLHDLRKEKAFT